jgi:hypothetical protein
LAPPDIPHLGSPLYRLWIRAPNTRGLSCWVFCYWGEAANIPQSSVKGSIESKPEGGLLEGVRNLTIKRNWNSSQIKKARKKKVLL